MSKKLKLTDIVFREDLYPRIESNPAQIQKYAEDISVLPPIEVNQHNILIDGFHRWTAHRKAKAETIEVIVIETGSDKEILALSIKKNATHGLQLSLRDKKKMAVRLYEAGHGMSKQEIAEILSVTERSISAYLSDIDKTIKKERDEVILKMYMACYTQDEIAEAVGVTKMTIANRLEVCTKMESLPKLYKLSAEYLDDFTSPVGAGDVWTFQKKTNEVSHFGNSEVTIVDNFLYLYTKPFSIVVDPFAGGGSTIDICKKRMRRYYVSDRMPIVEREHEIRKNEIVSALPNLGNRWNEVDLVYLDPPYWKQAEGKYSTDGEDLANQSEVAFHDNMASIINAFSKKMRSGSHIAMIIQNTQWNAPSHELIDHIFEIKSRLKQNKTKLIVDGHVPYTTQQFTPQMVTHAKENSMLLVRSRRMLVWQII